MSMRLDGKIALVTGASRGIGAATAQVLAEHGAAVAVNFFANSEAANSVVNAITVKGGKALAVQADVRDYAAAKSLVEKIETELGKIDILVLNAGAKVPMKSFVDMTHDEFMTKVRDEMNCFFHTAKLVVPSMIERKSGSIVGISSGLSRTAAPGFLAHTTAKSGIDGFMKALAFELGPHGIRANTIAPGLISTDATANVPEERRAQIAAMTPLRRIGEPEDVAKAVLAVASDDAQFVTGAYIPVSGGGLMI